MSPSVLVYADRSTARCRLHWLDCDEAKPKSGVLVRNATHVGEDDILFCCVQDRDNQFLVFGSDNEIFAYNVKTEMVEWNLPKTGKILDVTGITKDGHSYLFACYYRNSSIEMFSASDGQYLGCLIKAGDQDLGRPWRVLWCETSSSLVVAEDSDFNWIVSVIKLEF